MDYSKLGLNRDDLLTSIAYNLTESPTTQAYQSVAAQNNPDWAGFVGDIYRMGDINRANFNIGLQALVNKNKTKAALDAETRAYNHDREMRNLARKYQLADRDRAERLQILTMPQEETISGASDWQNSINPEQKQFIDTYNTTVNAKNNAQNYEDYIKNDRILQNLKKQQMFNSKVQAPDVDPSTEYLEGEVPLYKRALIKLFSPKAKEKINSLETLANKSQNVFNDPNRATNQGILNKISNSLFGDKSLSDLENFIRTNQIGQVAWNSNNKTIQIAQQLINSPEIKEFFGTNDLSNFELLDDPTVFGMNKTYIVDKNTNTPYKVMIDDTGTLRLFDPYEE